MNAIIEVIPTADLAEAFARRFVAAAQAAQKARGRFHVALTGGSAAKLYSRLAREPLDWNAIYFWWGDERAVPPTDEDSNFRLAKEALFDRASVPAANIHRMRGEGADLDAAARAYEAELRNDAPALDLVHVGVGPDGHVCSLFPGHALLAEKSRWVSSVTDSPKPPPRRLTLTLPVLHAARLLIVTATGAEKARVLFEARNDPQSALPIALATRPLGANAVWLLDPAAAGAPTV
jgi:6-phosphogluconolactonase